MSFANFFFPEAARRWVLKQFRMGMLGIILYMYLIIKPIETEYLIPFGNITYHTYSSHHSMISGKGLQWNRSFITSWWRMSVWSWSLDVLFILLVPNMIYKYRQPNLALGEGDLYQWTTLLPDSFEEPKTLPHVVLDGKISNLTSYQLSKGKCQYPHSLQGFNVSPLVAEFCHQQHFGGSPTWRPRRALVGGIRGVDKTAAHETDMFVVFKSYVCWLYEYFCELLSVSPQSREWRWDVDVDCFAVPLPPKKTSEYSDYVKTMSLAEIQAASERLVLFPAERLNGTQQVILCLQRFSRERSRLQKMRPDTPKCACAQDHVQTTRVWWGGTL